MNILKITMLPSKLFGKMYDASVIPLDNESHTHTKFVDPIFN